MYAPNGKASQFLKEKLVEFKEEIDNKTILVGDLNLPPSDLDKSNQKTNKKEIREVNGTLEKLELIDIRRKLNRDEKGIHFLFNSTWNIHKDCTFTRAQKHGKQMQNRRNNKCKLIRP